MENITEGDIQQYILYLKKEKGLSAGTINNYISAIKFFYTYVLDKDEHTVTISIKDYNETITNSNTLAKD